MYSQTEHITAMVDNIQCKHNKIESLDMQPSNFKTLQRNNYIHYIQKCMLLFATCTKVCMTTYLKHSKIVSKLHIVAHTQQSTCSNCNNINIEFIIAV